MFEFLFVMAVAIVIVAPLAWALEKFIQYVWKVED